MTRMLALATMKPLPVVKVARQPLLLSTVSTLVTNGSVFTTPLKNSPKANIRQENCPPGTAELTAWANYYCASGERADVPSGKMSTPADDNTHLRTGYTACPAYHTCSFQLNALMVLQT